MGPTFALLYTQFTVGAWAFVAYQRSRRGKIMLMDIS